MFRPSSGDITKLYKAKIDETEEEASLIVTGRPLPQLDQFFAFYIPQFYQFLPFLYICNIA